MLREKVCYLKNMTDCTIFELHLTITEDRQEIKRFYEQILFQKKERKKESKKDQVIWEKDIRIQGQQ